METPHIDHLSTQDYEHIYEPAEDSFLLLDALEADLEFIEKQLKPSTCLEIGPGSGIVITALAKRLRDCLCLACDINPYACRASKRTSKRNGVQIECINGSLVDALKCNAIDLLIFNPPYVVTSDEEVMQHSFEFGNRTKCDLVHSWAGGESGRAIIDILLPKLNDILAPSGVFYLLLLRDNRPDDIMQTLSQMGFVSEKYMERRIPGEYLYILKIRRRLT